MMENTKICYFCSKSVEDRVTFNNINDMQGFVLMPKEMSCHLECYINEIIKERLDIDSNTSKETKN